MKYLVLKPIRAYGIRYERGELIDETQVRTPRILIGEHKITPVKAVSSSIKPAVEESHVDSSVLQVKEDKKPTRLSFKKEE